MCVRVPSSLAIDCPMCGERAPHRVIKGKVGGGRERLFEGVVKCGSCGHTHTATVRERLPTTASLIVSWLGDSRRGEVELQPDELIEIGQELETPEGPVEVTSIESGGRRVDAATGNEVGVIWAKVVDRSRVKLTINMGASTKAAELVVDPETEFTVGSSLEVDGRTVQIHKIMKRSGGLLKRGTATAGEIRRIYARGGRRPAGEGGR